ncbi:hypothetical protein Cni_G15738 [Canna indica]|uniref:Uncharacterized protein n=1 Tax=Canna indica TaxID=4628 RepID=A0AAQ3QF79_9LILI|nr:hypothetical protein Cni_G15738 [Canna indica]
MWLATAVGGGGAVKLCVTLLFSLLCLEQLVDSSESDIATAAIALFLIHWRWLLLVVVVGGASNLALQPREQKRKESRRLRSQTSQMCEISKATQLSNDSLSLHSLKVPNATHLSENKIAERADRKVRLFSGTTNLQLAQNRRRLDLDATPYGQLSQNRRIYDRYRRRRKKLDF